MPVHFSVMLQLNEKDVYQAAVKISCPWQWCCNRKLLYMVHVSRLYSKLMYFALIPLMVAKYFSTQYCVLFWLYMIMRYTVLFLVWEDLNFFLVTLQNFEELKMHVPGLMYIVMQQLSVSILIDNHLSLQVWHLPQTASLQSSVNFLICICHLHFSTLSFWRITCHFTQAAQIRQQLTNFEQIGLCPFWHNAAGFPY